MWNPARTSPAVALAALLIACGSGEAPDPGSPDPTEAADPGARPPEGSAPPTSTGTNAPAPVEEGTARITPTIGAPIALSIDNHTAVVANRSGEIAVLDLDLASAPGTGAARVTFDEGDGEPWAAVLDGTEEHAFVVLRNSREVVRIDDPSGSPSLSQDRAPTDSEPSSIAISPLGKKLFVANWGAGNVTVIDTKTMQSHTVDLNAALVDTGVLGAVTSRPGLARPYAIAVTNDGDADDDDETVFVTEFFGQDDPRASFSGDDAFFDTNKQGFVYAFNVGTERVAEPISLGASADMGFVDSNGVTAGCSPNQLYSLAIDGSRLYVAGLCASPRGPAAPGAVDKIANVKTKVQPVLYVVDANSQTELTGERLHLNRAWEDEYVATGVPDDASRRYPLIVQSMAFVPQPADAISPLHVLYLAAYGADAMFRVEFDGSGAPTQIGSSINDFVNLAAAPTTGKLPVGIWVTANGNALVVNDNTRNLSVVDLGTQAVESVIPTASPIDASDAVALAVNDGERFFATGTGRWSLNGQAWNSCEGCHPGGLTDNVTWFFATGPRQTVALDGSYGPNDEHRVFNWTGIFDEIADFEGNTRGISGGVGAIVHDNTGGVVNDDRIVFDGTPIAGLQVATDTLQAGLNGSTFEVIRDGVPGHDLANVAVDARSAIGDWDDLELWAEVAIRSPNAPALDAAQVAAGAQLFTTHGCNGCHGGPAWTVSERFYTPSQATNDATNGTLSTQTYSRGNLPPGLNPPADAGGGSAVLRSGGSIQCVLRDIGTFDTAPAGVVLSERKEDMVSVATGATGFNPPSLLSASAGAPYLHGGQARTLEEVFSAFPDHCRALSANCSLGSSDLADLVAFLQSIDADTATLGTNVGAIDTVLCE